MMEPIGAVLTGCCGKRVTQALSTSTATDLCSRSEEHTSELQSLAYLVCRLLLEKKKNQIRFGIFQILQIVDVVDIEKDNPSLALGLRVVVPRVSFHRFVYIDSGSFHRLVPVSVS